MLPPTKLLPPVKWKRYSRAGALDYFFYFSPQHLVPCCVRKFLSSWLTVDRWSGAEVPLSYLLKPCVTEYFKTPSLPEWGHTLSISGCSNAKIKQRTDLSSYIWFILISSIRISALSKLGKEGWSDTERINWKEWEKLIHWSHVQYARLLPICKKWMLHLEQDQQEDV